MKKSPKLSWPIVVLCFLPGFAYIWFGSSAITNTQQSIEVYQSQSWATEKAEIVDGKIENFWGQGFQQKFRVVLRYRYLVNSQVFETDTSGLEMYTSSVRNYAQSYLDDYKLGNKIDIKFNPKNPDQSCFRCETSPLEIAFTVFLWLIVFSGFYLTFRVSQFVLRKV